MEKDARDRRPAPKEQQQGGPQEERGTTSETSTRCSDRSSLSTQGSLQATQPDQQKRSAATSQTQRRPLQQQGRRRRRRSPPQESQSISLQEEEQHQNQGQPEQGGSAAQRPSTLLLLEGAARAVTTRALAPYYSTTLGFLAPPPPQGQEHRNSIHINAERHVDELEQTVRNVVRFVRYTVIPGIRILLQIQVIGTILLLLSTISYALLYVLTMPSAHWRQPLYFDYTMPNSVSTADTPTAIADVLSLHTQWNPAQSDVVPEPLLFGTTLRSKSFSSSSRRLLLARERYFMEVALVLPDSEWNRHHVGIFMLHIQLYSSSSSSTSQRQTQSPNSSTKEKTRAKKQQQRQQSGSQENCTSDSDANLGKGSSNETGNTTTSQRDGCDASGHEETEKEADKEKEEKCDDEGEHAIPHPRLLATSRRSAIFPHESFFVGAIRKFLFLFPYTFGMMHEAKRIVVPIFDHYVESRKLPLTTVHVQLVPVTATFSRQCDEGGIGRPSPTCTEGSVPQTSRALPHVIQGELIVGKELNVLQRLMKTWFYTCATVGILCLSAYYGLLLWGIRWYVQRWKRQRRQQQQQQEGEGEATAGAPVFTNQRTSASQRQGVASSRHRNNNGADEENDDEDDDDDMWEETEVRNDHEEVSEDDENEQQDGELLSPDEMYDDLEPVLLDESESRMEAADRDNTADSPVPTTEERE